MNVAIKNDYEYNILYVAPKQLPVIQQVYFPFLHVPTFGSVKEVRYPFPITHRTTPLSKLTASPLGCYCSDTSFSKTGDFIISTNINILFFKHSIVTMISSI